MKKHTSLNEAIANGLVVNDFNLTGLDEICDEICDSGTTAHVVVLQTPDKAYVESANYVSGFFGTIVHENGTVGASNHPVSKGDVIVLLAKNLPKAKEQYVERFIAVQTYAINNGREITDLTLDGAICRYLYNQLRMEPKHVIKAMSSIQKKNVRECKKYLGRLKADEISCQSQININKAAAAEILAAALASMNEG